MQIRILTPEDAHDYFTLRLRGLREHPYAFGRAADDWAQVPIGQIQERLQSVGVHFGAFEDGKLLGIGMLYQESGQKNRHRASINGMYVLPEARGRGIGRAILNAALDHARTLDGVEDIHIAVTVGNDRVRALYASVGFKTWGIAPRHLKVDDQYYDLERMVLSLTSSPA